MMKRISWVFVLFAGLILAACDGEEPEKTRVGSGDLDSVEGNSWVAYAYATPYRRGGSTYEFLLLIDYRDMPDDYYQGRTEEEVGQDVVLELAEITTTLCSIQASRVQDWDVVDTQFGFVNVYVDCR